MCRRSMLYDQRVYALASFALTVAGCTPTFPEDLDHFCRIVNEADSEPSLTAAEKLARINARRDEYARTPLLETRDNWRDAEKFEGADKYQYLVAAAKQSGRPDWKCPNYGKLLNAEQLEKIAATMPKVETKPEAPKPAEIEKPASPPSKPKSTAKKSRKGRRKQS